MVMLHRISLDICGGNLDSNLGENVFSVNVRLEEMAGAVELVVGLVDAWKRLRPKAGRRA